LSLFRAVLGDKAQVERTDHILAGARRCAYRITAAAD
jgi:predicted ArsR family transcriptional regulator